MSKIIKVIKSYLTAKGEVDESIVIITIIFIIEMYVLLFYVASNHDIPIHIMSYLEYIWAGSVGLYITKAIATIWRQ